MKIAVLTSGILPVPAVQGGAVENLIEFYLEYNEKHQLHDITIYSIYDPKVHKTKYEHYFNCHFHFINTQKIFYKIKKTLFRYLYKNIYYDPTIEYFMHSCLNDIARQKYDYIIMENRPGYVLEVSKITDAKLVVHLHNDFLNAKISNSKEILDKCYRILTVSDYIKKRVETIYLTNKVRTVHNGINIKAFNQKRTDINHITRASLGFKDTDFILVFSGRIVPEKGVNELIDTMLMLKDKANIKLMIIGNSFFGNETNENSYISMLKQKAEPIKQNIIFTGFVPYSDMPNYLRISDVAIIPSMWEDPFPTTVLEAQAMGLPIICTNKGGIPEEVGQDNAILLDVNDKIQIQLYDAITSLYENPEKCSYMAKASLSRAELFDKESYSSHFFDSMI